MTTKSALNFDKMKLNELQAMFAEVVGETTRSPNRTYLIRRITEASGNRDRAPDVAPQETAPAPWHDREQVAPMAAVNSAPSNTAPDATENFTQPRLTQLDPPALQARYEEILGRATSSTNHAYLVWKIHEAQRGRVPVGPRRRADRPAVKVLPLRMDASLVLQLGEAWRRMGLSSPMDLFRRALQLYLAEAGEIELAGKLASPALDC